MNHRLRILLADDHRGITEALKKVLSPEFHLVGVVEDGLALIDAAAKLKPDVIVADISMPRLDGLKALIELKKENPDTRVVFMTMYQDASIARHALDLGALGFILKYSATTDLPPAIHAAMAGTIYISPPLAGKI